LVNTRIGAVACAFVTVATLVGSIGAASAVGARSVLDLELDDDPGATAAVDTSGLGHSGTIGSHPVLNGSYAHFDRHSPTEGIAYGLAHLITIPDAPDGSLDPGSGNFSVEIRYRTKESFGNVLQKGQATSVGGQVKLQQPKGKMTCMFKTPQGTATAGSGLTPLNDNQFHIVRCDRTPTSVTMYVDGVQTGKVNHVTGNLDNKLPWTVGGKSDCDALLVTCDYFAGDIDYVRLTKGDASTVSGSTRPTSAARP
jgi:Concanavalin A-like lectin/glucanases superfamily